MKFAFETIDERVRAINVVATISHTDYLALAEHIIDNESNPYQRKKLKKRDRTYEILRNDLRSGCLMPPLVLSANIGFGEDNSDTINKLILKSEWDVSDIETIRNLVLEAIDSKSVLILDGVQRTYALQDAFSRSESLVSIPPLRVEFYLGLRKAGLLYRMMTLNTGQTPMSPRHQIEIVFLDYIQSGTMPEEIDIIREIDNRKPEEMGSYEFQDVVGLYHAYLTRSPAPIDRKAILAEITRSDFMSSFDSRSEADLLDLIKIYNLFVNSINESVKNWSLDESLRLSRPFGRTLQNLFSRPQPMAGFGSACIRLIDDGIFSDLSNLVESLQSFKLKKKEASDGLEELNKILSEITEESYKSKIGRMQRAYFDLFFRDVIPHWANKSLDLKRTSIEALSRFQLIY